MVVVATRRQPLQTKEAIMKSTLFRTMLTVGAIGVTGFTGALALSPAEAATSTPSAASTSDHPSRAGGFAKLTDAQKQCLSNAGLTRPEGRPSAEQNQQFREAAKACGLEKPANVGRSSNGGQRRLGQRFQQLSAEQRECLTEAGVTRPEGRPSVDQRKKLRAAAADCNSEIPARGAHSR